MNTLILIEPSISGFREAISRGVNNGRSSIALLGSGELASLVKTLCMAEFPALTVVEDWQQASIVCCVNQDAQALSADLMQLIDCKQVQVIAPQSAAFYRQRPVYTVSVPKSGTHLLFELVQAMGYQMNHFSTQQPDGGHAYYLEYSNSHTKATSFFIDTVYTSEFGGRDHPFTYTPSLFMYRHPLDIVLSEARYYPKQNNTLFYQYLKNLSLEDCITKLLDDPFLLGSLRNRLIDYAAWTDFENVIPIAFEDLIGSKGGGDDALRDRLIWSIQLKLHVPGSPSDIGDKIFNDHSPTFNKGQVGSYRVVLKDEHYRLFDSLNQDFMAQWGYSKASPFSSRSEEFRRRALVVPPAPVFPPILLDHDFNGFNIVKYKNRFYGVKLGFAIDFETADMNALPTSKIIAANTLNEVRAKVLLQAPHKSAREIIKSVLKS